jgi:hypothetical protein
MDPVIAAAASSRTPKKGILKKKSTDASMDCDETSHER